VTVAYGSFWVGLVLGWAALFAGGLSARARLVQFGWVAALILFALFAPDPRLAALGVLSGAVGHLAWLARLRECRA
jgi:hypothetical protein